MRVAVTEIGKPDSPANQTLDLVVCPRIGELVLTNTGARYVVRLVTHTPQGPVIAVEPIGEAPGNG